MKFILYTIKQKKRERFITYDANKTINFIKIYLFIKKIIIKIRKFIFLTLDFIRL